MARDLFFLLSILLSFSFFSVLFCFYQRKMSDFVPFLGRFLFFLPVTCDAGEIARFFTRAADRVV